MALPGIHLCVVALKLMFLWMHLRSSPPSALGLPSFPKRHSQGAQSIAKKKKKKKKI